MRVARTAAELRGALRGADRAVGLVPTMGALHAGHAALLRAARAECATVAASIFVNPAQFGPGEDLETYPRDMEGDLSAMEREGVDVVFCPSVEEMYPAGFDTTVSVGALSERLEGRSRPGHLSGVATVVCKLICLARPDRAYFGRKDAQQLLVVRRMAADLGLGARIVEVPTVRDPDGLAASSRNARLGPAERAAALGLCAALGAARAELGRGVRDAAALREAMRREMEASGAAVDYVSVADPETLRELGRVEGRALALVAGSVGGVRLIDNEPLRPLGCGP